MAHQPRKVVIVGAAGRDFHNFNVAFRDDDTVRVVAFTGTQIPGISDRIYPAELAGARYPHGIPIVDESELESLCKRERVDEVVFAYSDVSHQTVMHTASRVLACGPDFVLLGPDRTMLRSRLPTITVCAARTGSGKSQISRHIATLLSSHGIKAAAIRHPMPYGDLAAQRVQRFASTADLDAGHCTVEEREEYEPFIAAGHAIYAGVDYAAILEAAETEADVIIWDGGNNDFAFIRPDLEIAVVDALRATQTATHHPGETVLRRAHVVVINKVDVAPPDAIGEIGSSLDVLNPNAEVVHAASPARVEDPERVRGRAVLVIDDGPSLTHGDMPYGAGYVAAVAAGAREIVDPRASAVPSVAALYERYPQIGRVLPAVGYAPEQLAALKATVDASRANIVVSGTPCDIATLAGIERPVVRARYQYAPAGPQDLDAIIERFARDAGLMGASA